MCSNQLGEACLYYYNARWYDPETGRFVTEDPAKDGLNWYIYAGNNPVKYTDPTGMRRTKKERKARRAKRRARRETRREAKRQKRQRKRAAKAEKYERQGKHKKAAKQRKKIARSDARAQRRAERKGYAPTEVSSVVRPGSVGPVNDYGLPFPEPPRDPAEYLFPIGPTTKSNWRCDQMASYTLYDQEYNPQNDLGEPIDFDGKKVHQIYGKFNDDNKHLSPPGETGGYVFNRFSGKKPEHMQAYERKGDTVTVWETTGKAPDPPVAKNYDINELTNVKKYSPSVWIPRPRF